MNLIIDVGNTLVKLAVFEENTLLSKKVTSKTEFQDVFNSLSKAYPKIESCIVSSVGDFGEQNLRILQKKYNVLELTHQTKIPFENKYATPNTLGVDRIALISAAAVQFPDENVLVIDAGSCVTYDFLSEENEYLGGGISPGLQMRYKAVHHFTASLPLLESGEAPDLIGNATETSMHTGIFNGLVFELNGFIDAYAEKYSNLTVILTGGDAQLLQKNLKKGIFANSNFLLEGLHQILELNKD